MILGIEEIASKDEIKKAYRRLVKLYHPDSTEMDSLQAKEIFHKIQKAYESLG